MNRLRQSIVLVGTAILLLLPMSAPAYYHFIRYVRSGGVTLTAVERFDVASLPGKTVPFFVDQKGPEAMAAGDSFPALLSQIRAAAQVWNGVGSSTLRLRFGGLAPSDMPMKSPHVQVIFDEVPPGLVALGGPVTRGEMVNAKEGAYFPIVKSQLILPKNLADPARPSSTERLFLTLVHELGHTIGLQHTWSSGVMSTEITRATTKGAPLSADDVAGISALYPAPGFRSQTGSITGRITLDGQGVHLASVAAMTPTGWAVTALTSPDGTYRIEGLAPGEYFVYAQPVPPSLQGEPQPVNLELPLGPDGPIAPGRLFDSIFYPGTPAPQTKVVVEVGKPAEAVNIAVTPRDRINIHSVQTYSFIGNIAIKPGAMWQGQQQGQVVLFGYGLSTGTAPVAGLGVSVLGAQESLAPGGLNAYAPSPIYLDLKFGLLPDSPVGARHVMFSAAGERHVAPSAFRIASVRPPSIGSIKLNADKTVTLEGQNLTSSTRVLFDGAPASFSGFDEGRLTMRPPSALSEHHAVVTAYDGEGQSSLMVQGSASPVFAFDAAEAPDLTTDPPAIARGVESVIELTGKNLKFDADARVGLGTSDLSVVKSWVVAPDKVLAWVASSPSAPLSYLTLSAVSGLQFASKPNGFHTTDDGALKPFVAMTAMQLSETPYSGSIVTLPLRNVPETLAPGSVQVLVGGVAAPVTAIEKSLVSVMVPAGLGAGPARVNVTVNGVEAWPAALELVTPPPAILQAQTVAGGLIGAGNPPEPGNVVQLVVKGLGDGAIEPEDITLLSGNKLSHTVLLVMETANPDLKLVVFALSPDTPPGEPALLTLTHKGRTSKPFTLPVL